jgi:hypothetical protein
MDNSSRWQNAIASRNQLPSAIDLLPARTIDDFDNFWIIAPISSNIHGINFKLT